MTPERVTCNPVALRGRARQRGGAEERSPAGERSEVDGSIARLLKQLAATDLLILDDWGLDRLKDAHAQLLLEIIEDRQTTGSVLITSQFAVGSWHERIGNPTVADALLDRLVHHAHRIDLKGESMRKMKPGRTTPRT